VSEVSFNPILPPEAPGTTVERTTQRPAASPDNAATNPFAALLSGVLQGAQPVAAGLESGTDGATDAQLTDPDLDPDASTDGASLLALPGTATALPPLADDLSGGASGGHDGNPLPASGKELPLQPAGPGASTDLAAGPGADLGTPHEAAGLGTTTPAATGPRIFLADLALSRPLEPPTGLPIAAPEDGAGTAAVLAGRSFTPGANGEKPARSGDPVRRLAAGSDSPVAGDSGSLASANTNRDVLTSVALASGDALARRSAQAEPLFPNPGLPGVGTAILAGQIAAFAAGRDSTTGTGSSAPTATGTGDAASAALTNRLGSTGLPPLQPLGDAGAFAGGLADRLLTLGGPGSHSARLKLHPEHLGELDVDISIEDGNARVWFGTTTSQAREAIEGSLPQLRQLFAEQGIQLTRTQVDAGGGQMGHSGFGSGFTSGFSQERRMSGDAGAWNAAPAWQAGRSRAPAGLAGVTTAGASARLLDVWA
jgi:flagellar hook-length control protein FliK